MLGASFFTPPHPLFLIVFWCRDKGWVNKIRRIFNSACSKTLSRPSERKDGLVFGPERSVIPGPENNHVASLRQQKFERILPNDLYDQVQDLITWINGRWVRISIKSGRMYRIYFMWVYSHILFDLIDFFLSFYFHFFILTFTFRHIFDRNRFISESHSEIFIFMKIIKKWPPDKKPFFIDFPVFSLEKFDFFQFSLFSTFLPPPR